MKVFFLLLLVICCENLCGQNKHLLNQLVKNKHLIALWDFKEDKGEKRKSWLGSYELSEMDGSIERVEEGPLSGYSAKFGHGAYLSLPNNQTGLLNIYGPGQGVTVAAWVKWTGETTGFVGGMWNEYLDGGKRQYGLFVSLPHYNGKNQVCGHISYTGKPTPLFLIQVITLRANKKLRQMNGLLSLLPTMDNICVRMSMENFKQEKKS